MSGTSERAARPRLLVALDGSPAAATALPFARAIAARLRVGLEALVCVAGEEADLRQQVRLQLEPGESMQVRSHTGEPATALLEAAADPEAVLLVLTAHGRGQQPRRRLGRVVEAVVAGTTRPVSIVRPETAIRQDGSGRPRLERLLLPLDGTPSTAEALQPATDLASRLGTAIDLLYVVSRDQKPPKERGSIVAPRYVDQPHHEWSQWAREVVDRLCTCMAKCPPTVEVQMYVAVGEIGSEIVRFATEHEIDIIALVRRSQLERGHAAVLREILDRAPCPVLVVGGVALEESSLRRESTPAARASRLPASAPC
jgi:nucleotide-binding universal stress UspA family protein